jgi:thioredoxin:protein disulfide reductase
VAAPPAGALLYISQTGDAFVGGSALFALAAGMSLPLLAVGASAGALVPRAGAWMEGIKRVFGVLMLGTALWIVEPVLPPRLAMAGWTLLALGCAAWLLLRRPRRALLLAAGLVAALLGGAELAGLAAGGSDPLSPFGAERSERLAFRRVHSVQELDAALASTAGRAAMLDFYADWCVSCKEMEKFTFADPRVRARLGQLVLLQADVTANSAADQALLKRFQLFGPPGIMFFTPAGTEAAQARVIGYQDTDRFLHALDAVAAAPQAPPSIP